MPRRILLACTGSVAALKVPELAAELYKLPEVEVRVVATENAKHFFDTAQLSVDLYSDQDEWKWSKRGDPVLHIELGKWADLMLIAPLDANTLAKLANGICDNLLTCIARAWDLTRPLIVCPAMNTRMWTHPFTARHLSVLREELGFHEVPPIFKTLVCGDSGIGAMATVNDIVRIVDSYLPAVVI
ncbi:phosphopantothenoylcysteine decarboxylase-like [Dysidea avara]|uniref:phosphopantothenoylcysteine decarboxylase-like n=1 Tax=Dysidea avara TaxID=196820 RepID=UPI00331CD72C